MSKIFAINEDGNPKRLLVMVEEHNKQPRCIAAVHTSEAFNAIKQLFETATLVKKS